MAVRVGVDVGGTFTDAVRVDEETGEIVRTKVLTTAADQSEGTVAALQRLIDDPSTVSSFHHGYTVGINAALTRRGARTGMLVTAGHRDTVDTGRAWRPFDENLYDATWERPHQARPIVDRRFRREVPERLRHDGEVVLPLDEDAVRRELEFFKAEGVESVGICLLHAYENNAHEQRVAEIVREEMPGVYVQTSEVWPLAREFDRTFVVMLDAYTGPPVDRYLQRLKERLAEAGFDTRVEIMRMDGGLRQIDSVRTAPVYTVQSGPVAGLLGAETYSRELLDGRALVCVDIGGTSTDLGVVHEGRAEVTNEWELEHAIPLSITTLDVRSIGAGGGSLIGSDKVGSLTVGPESAGSEPGPACYGRGGTKPAMTDAYVAMGLLQPDLFLGGEMSLDRDASLQALNSVAEPLGLDAVSLAEGAFAIANTKIAAAAAAMTIARGLDPREFALFGYGAAGPIHSVGVARELGVKEVIVPFFPGGFSAFGMIASRSRVEYSQATMQPLDALGPDGLGEIVTGLGERCRADLEGQGLAGEDITLSFAFYGMYAGQGHDSRLPLPPPPYEAADLERVKDEFHDFYDQRYGYRAPEIDLVFTSVSAVAFGPEPNVVLPVGVKAPGDSVERALKKRATVHLDREEHVDAPIYERSLLAEGDEINGAAIIDDQLGTIVVNPGAVARVGKSGTLRIEV